MFLDKLLKELPCRVMLFGAERERATIEQILAAKRPNVLSAGTGNTIRQFQALLARCAVVVTGDSLGMHLAIAEKRPVVALFGPTCAQEIELYGPRRDHHRRVALRSVLSRRVRPQPVLHAGDRGRPGRRRSPTLAERRRRSAVTGGFSAQAPQGENSR